jgi:hypothetical protein
MNRNNDDDRQIKTFFDELKEHDLRAAPSFSKSWELASSKVTKGFRQTPFFKFAATCALLILFGITGFLLWHERTPKPGKYATISQWRPPTEFLLKIPGQEWLKTVPKLGQSLEQQNRRK